VKLMNAFTPAIRASLQADASKVASQTLRQWSMRELLGINLLSRTTTTTSDGNNNHHVNDAKLLLREVQIRLAIQHAKLISMSTSMEAYANNTFNEKKRRRDDDDDDGMMIRNAQQCLQSLLRLHEDTYLLPHRIMDGDWHNLLVEPYTKPNRKYVTNVFDEIMSRHGSVVETLADAVIYARIGCNDSSNNALPNLLHDNTIESFLHSRLLIQLLCDHYISLHRSNKLTGAITLDANIEGIIDDATTEARHVCDTNLGIAPEVVIEIDDSIDLKPPPLVRSWLHHAIVEVTKNAMTSNVQKCYSMPQNNNTIESMPSNVHFRVGIEKTSLMCKYLTIQIIDQGMGIRNINEAFGFAQTSSPKRWDRIDEQQSYAAVRQPLGSLGVGLPLSRLMLRIFGGDLIVTNNTDREGGGCKALLRINYDDTHIAKN
jgi:pyruvate dehydrogenase kinase 2/3/4